MMEVKEVEEDDDDVFQIELFVAEAGYRSVAEGDVGLMELRLFLQ